MRVYFAWTNWHYPNRKFWGAFTDQIKAYEAAGWTGTSSFLNHDRHVITLVECNLDEVSPQPDK